MAASAVERFKAKYETLAGSVHLCPDDGAAAGVVAAICREAGGGRIAVGPLGGALDTVVPEALAAAGMEVYARPFRAADVPDGIDRASVGVTAAAFAIAETGSLVELTTDDAVRLVSTLPRVHVGLFRRTDLVETLKEAAPRISAFFRANPESAVVTFISGPSRTADIEMRLTLGVHGPEVAHAVVVG